MELINDLKKINSFDNESFQNAINTLSIEDDTDNWKFQLQEISKHGGKDTLNALVRFLNFLAENFSEARDYSSQISELDSFLSNILKNNDDEEEAKHGWERVKNSLNKLDGFFLKKKEDNIKNRFSRITNFKIVTDIRPIFNMDKKTIHKLTFPSILKIETYDEREFICEFYEETLDKLIEELQLAKNKMEFVKENYGRK